MQLVLLIAVLIGTLFGFVPNGQAQSVQTWSEPMNLSMSGAATNPSLVVDGKGTLHVFWVDEFVGYQYTTSVDGVTWSAPKAVKYPFNSKGLPPRFIVDDTGRVHIFWINEKNALMYAQTTEAGMATPPIWFAVRSLDAPIYDFDAAIDAGGNVHVSYIKNPKPPSIESSGAYYILSPDRGVSWRPERLLYESAYFRSVDAASAHIRLAVSTDLTNENVYTVWDDRSQKHVFLAISRNGGEDWEETKDIIAPDAALGFKTPFASDIDVLQEAVLLTWQVGEPGVSCAVYSRASKDNGESWDDPIRVLAESTRCPERSEFLSLRSDYSAMLTDMQGSLSMIVWNRSEWSNPEIQTGPSSIINPATFETVVLGCQKTIPFNNRLFVIGCDEGDNSDIWFTSRELDPLESLFPSPSTWGLEKNITVVPQKITSVSSVTDTKGNAHVLWIQSGPLETEESGPRFMYTRWNGSEWSKPAPVITELDGLPVHASLAIDTQQRLLLTWSNQDTGDLLFSWAASERANTPFEWSEPVVLPSPAKINDSPNMVVDASGRIVVAYAVVINENRGIYLTQSTGPGETWLAPQQAFDAVTADWDRVDQPKLAFTEDGVLHLLFSQYAARTDERSGRLFYSQSVDGGASWTAPDAVGEHNVEWSFITSIPRKGLHLIWQEEDNSSTTTYHRFSLDGGKTWNAPRIISSVEALSFEPVISVDWEGNIHFLQTSVDDLQYLSEWVWSNDRWQLVDTKRISSPARGDIVLAQSGVTSRGELYAVFRLESATMENEFENELISLNRSLELSTTPEPFTALITAPVVTAVTTEDASPIQTISTSVPQNVELDETSGPMIKNIVGLVLVTFVVAIIVVLIVPKKKK